MPSGNPSGNFLHYEEAGTGAPVVLLHGLGGNAAEWALQKAALAPHYRVIVPELRGHGKTPAPAVDLYTPFDHARDVVALLDHLQVEQAWFVGLSAGGFCALAMALEHPSRVRGLVLVATTAHVDKYTTAVAARWFETLQKEGYDAYIYQEMKDIFSPDWLMEHLDEIEKFKESQKGRDLKGIAPSAKANGAWDVRPRIGRIHVPTLVVHGMDDRVVDPTSARILRQTILGAEMKLYANTGHAVPIERPEEFNALLLDFLGRGEAARGGAPTNSWAGAPADRPAGP